MFVLMENKASTIKNRLGQIVKCISEIFRPLDIVGIGSPRPSHSSSHAHKFAVSWSHAIGFGNAAIRGDSVAIPIVEGGLIP